MKRKLRHPIRSITEPYGKAGLLVAILALVLATTGAAFAAAGLSGKQKKEVEKIAKKVSKPGPAGAQGPAGPAGANGKDGTNGSPGAPGANGKSVVTSAAAVPSECPTGTTGTKFEVEGSGNPSHVCNGKNGTTGFTKTLPSGESETGNWSLAGTPVPSPFGGEGVLAPISFNIPLSAAIPSTNVHVIKAPTFNEVKEEFEFPTPPSGCGGTVQEPEAEPGNLCIFTGVVEENLASITALSYEIFGEGAGKSGTELVGGLKTNGQPVVAFGDWVVTAAP